MPAYLVSLPDSGGQTLYDKATDLLIFATDVAEARLWAASFAGPDQDTAWSADATVVEVVTAVDWAGWVFTVAVPAPTAISVSYTAIAADAHDDVGAALVALLNADAQIAGAAYAVNTLTVSDIADDLGDLTLTVTATAPGAEPFDLSTTVWTSIVHEGISGAVLEADLPSVPPGQVVGAFNS